ncbi:hypothetical protein ACHAXT_001939 [Thalassiosira profunda]
MARMKAEIYACHSVDELVQLVHEHLDGDVPPNVLSLFWTKLHNLLDKPPRQRSGGVDWNATGRQLNDVLGGTASEIDAVPPALLGRVAQALASIAKKVADGRGGRTDPQKAMLQDVVLRGRPIFWAELVDRAAKTTDDFRPKGLVSVAWALATAAGPLKRYGNAVDVAPFFHSLHETFAKRPGEFSSKHLGNLAWACMTCQHEAPGLFEDFAAEFVRRRKREEAHATSGEGIISTNDIVDPTTLCQWANAYAKAGHAAPALFRSLAETSVPLLSDFDARHCANLAHAFGRAGEAPRLDDGSSFFDALAAAAVSRARQFDPQNVANVLWAYAKAEHDSPELFGTLARVAVHRLKEFDARQLANVAWALSKFPASAGAEVFDRIADEVASRGSLDAFTSQGLAMLALAFGTIGHASNVDFWDGLERAVVARSSELGPIECSQIAWSLAKVERRSEDAFDAIQRTAMSKMGSIQPQGLSNLAWAFATAERGDPHFFETIAGESLQKLDAFTPHDKVMLVLAYAQIDAPYPEIFDRIAEQSFSRLGEFSGLDLFNVAISYVKAGHASEPLMKAIATEIIRRPSHFPVELLVGIAHAYASVDCRNPALFYTIANECLEGGCNEINPKGIASLAWSFATLDVFHSPLLGALADASEGRWDAFDARSLARMAWAFAKAREDRHQLFESVANAAIARRDEFEPQSISMLLWACSDVGHLDQRLFESLAPVAAASLKDSTAQGLATIAWANAVANVDAPCLFNDAFIDACAEKESELQTQTEALCQLHQYNVWRREISGHASLPPALGQRCYDAFINQPTRQSKLQNDVISEMTAMGIDLKQEALTPSGYRLDALVDVNGKQIGVEVDGPHHFIDRRPAGSAILKQRQVSGVDEIPVVSLAYWEWNELETSHAKQEYLRLKLS